MQPPLTSRTQQVIFGGRIGMAASKKKKTPDNLMEIPGYPGLYTPITVTRNPKKEKALWAKILRDARWLRSGTLADRLISLNKPFLIERLFSVELPHPALRSRTSVPAP